MRDGAAGQSNAKEQRSFPLPEPPSKPKLPTKPSQLRKVDDEAKRKGYFTSSDSYRDERCHGCNKIVGKDYGSFSHYRDCEGARLRTQWMKPQREYEEQQRRYEQELRQAKAANRLLAIGLDYESAQEAVEGSALWLAEELLDLIEPKLKGAEQ